MTVTLAAALALSAPVAPTVLKPKIASASLFKNGYAVVVRTLPVSQSGDYLLETIPQASLGTLWFATTPGVTLTEVVSTNTSRMVSFPLATMDAILAANLGKTFRLGLKDGDAVTGNQVSGKVLGVSAAAVVIDTGSAILTIPRATVTSLSAPSGSIKVSGSTTATSRAIRFRVQSGGAGSITMVSLEPGLSWMPGYAVDISDPKKLRLVAKATIINDLGPLDNILARFVTGFPNLPFMFSQDPLVAGSPMLAGPAVGRMAGGFGGGGQFANQMAAGAPMSANFADAMPSTSPGGNQEGDLFFYRQPNVNLKQGDRAYYILFSAESEYSHLYTWDIADNVVNDTEFRPMGETPQEFWHSLKFKNTSGQPLTTGPATTMKAGEILGQDTLTYTPAGSELELRITKALDIKPEITEEEVNRQRQALVLPNRPSYDRVRLRGTMRILNTKNETLDAKITKELTGELVSHEGAEPEAIKTSKGLRAINPRTKLTWRLKLEPKSETILKFEYELFVQS